MQFSYDELKTLSQQLTKSVCRITLFGGNRAAFTSKKTAMRVFIKFLTGRCLTLEVQPSDSIDSVKQQIKERSGFLKADDRMILICAGAILEGGQTVSQFRINHDSTVHCIVGKKVLNRWTFSSACR